MTTTTWVKGCDFSYSKPDLQQLWDAGYRVILGYLSDTPGKGLTAAYVAEALALGFRIVLLYETTARAALGGRAAGIAQATSAMRIAKALGAPAAVTVIFALDSDYTTAEMATVAEFVAGLHAVAGSDGEYGGIEQLRYLIAHKTADAGRLFQTYAWSGGQWLTAEQAPIQQFHNGVHIAGGVVDDCRVDIDSTTITFWEATMADATLSAATEAAIAAAVIAAKIPNIPTDTDYTTLPNTALNTAIYRIRLDAAAAHAAAIQALTALAAGAKTDAAIQAALAVLTSSGTSVDTAAIESAIQAVGAAESTAVAALHQQIADLRTALAAAATGEAAALNGATS